MTVLPIVLTALALTVSADEPQPVRLTLLAAGGTEKAGYIGQGLGVELSAEKPAQITKAPDDLKAPKYGLFRFGDFLLLGSDGTPLPRPAGYTPPADAPTFAAILDEPEGGPKRLFVDTNRDGDLTNDPTPEWVVREGKGWDGAELKTYTGKAQFNLGTAESPRLLSLGLFRFDAKDQQRSMLAPYLVAYRDYLATGEVKLGDKTYPIMLSDEQATGDFRGQDIPAPAAKDGSAEPAAADEQQSGIILLIDVNANGAIDERGESYDARKPFNIGGVTYELTSIAADGSSASVIKSSKTVAEIKPPPDHGVGKKITPFEATLLDGKKVSFPTDYKGKVVLLDFWATWCGPCIHEIPNVVAAYDKFHAQGFEVLGISLDNQDALDKLKKLTADRKMPWPQVFEGKGWGSGLVDLYNIRGIPACWLVDGDTGLIVADESKLRGPQISATVEQALAARKKN